MTETATALIFSTVVRRILEQNPRERGDFLLNYQWYWNILNLYEFGDLQYHSDEWGRYDCTYMFVCLFVCCICEGNWFFLYQKGCRKVVRIFCWCESLHHHAISKKKLLLRIINDRKSIIAGDDMPSIIVLEVVNAGWDNYQGSIYVVEFHFRVERISFSPFLFHTLSFHCIHAS